MMQGILDWIHASVKSASQERGLQTRKLPLAFSAGKNMYPVGCEYGATEESIHVLPFSFDGG